MQDKQIEKTTDLGLGWSATKYDDGSMDIRNCDKGQRIALEKASVETLRNIFQSTDNAH